MEKDYLKDITEIRSIMEKSSRFISLSGLSGIMAGVYAIVGALVAYKIILPNDTGTYYELMEARVSDNLLYLVLDAMTVLILAIGTGIFFTTKKAKKQGVGIWDDTAKRVIINLLIPLIVGGVYCIILYNKGFLGLIAPVTLIFYGLALINASKYTFRDIRYLGMAEIILGLIASTTIGYGLIFWVIGFGALHIIYGAVMYFKYER